MKKTKCNKCNRDIKNCNFKRHFEVCNGTNKKILYIDKYKIDANKYKCPNCNKIFSKNGIGCHIWRNHTEEGKLWSNHGGPNNSYANGRKAWNIGLTKETDVRVKKYAESYKKGIQEGIIIPSQTGFPISEKQKELTRKTIRQKIENGEWHLSFSHARTHKYKGERFHGTWELNYAKWLDENNINWRRPKEKFQYIFDDKIKYYTPDFYLIDQQCYVEIKGYPVNKDFAKWDQFPLKLKIIPGRDLYDLGIIKDFRSRNIQYKNITWK